jgi:hypothetical protein
LQLSKKTITLVILPPPQSKGLLFIYGCRKVVMAISNYL